MLLVVHLQYKANCNIYKKLVFSGILLLIEFINRLSLRKEVVMERIEKLGLGCMGMNMANKERSIETIHYALERGITFLNTGEFYQAGESEMVLREALKGISRDKYFLSVKFGVLPKPSGGIYGLDVKPFNVKAHLTYSLHRLGLDYIDLYQPARMDESVEVEELMYALEECIKEGYIGSIGLTELSKDNLERAVKVHPVKMVEFNYSLLNRSIENNGILDFSRKEKIDVLAFGVLSHGLLSSSSSFPPEGKERILKGLGEIAEEKNTSIEKLAQAYVWNKNPDIKTLIGTTRKEHLEMSIDALSVSLTDLDIAKIESVVSNDASLRVMRNFVFRDGRMSAK